jgi:peptidyl-prolyl cis-trans isomerase SurA
MTMKKPLTLLMFSALIQGAHAAPVQEVDRIVAVVNKSVISELDLQDRIAEARISLKEQHVTPPPLNILRRQVLDQMLIDSVEQQYADNNRISISDKEVDQALERLAQRNKLSLDGLKAEIHKQHIPFDKFRADIRRELLLSRLKDSEVASRITVTDSEVDQAMKNALFANNTEYHLASILIEVQERASAEQIEEKARRAEKALAELNAGKPFGDVAANYSNAQNALKGGDLGWRPAASLPADFLGMLSALKAGQHTGVVRTQQGFYIFQLIDLRDHKAQQIAEQYHVQHILVRTNEVVSENDAKTKILQIRDRILRGASFAEMAKLYSEDGSNSKGGDLGWMSKGDTVPEFERVMLTLQKNTLSEPVRTPFGWHLIQVSESRAQDVSSDRARMQVRQQIRTRKIEEAYQNWVSQLRDSAYVEDRLNDK